ncbi:stimulator of interferon genes protein homolog [Anabrus simplex]|uniref:stimulator of interferon genes protein homolog n=1 Tax=Anabrus simplex TaxID=316456 RepID=UPI0035A3B85A
MDDQVVQENIEGEVIYPDNFPRKRQARAEWSAVIYVVVVILVAAWVNSTYSDDSSTFHDSLFQMIVLFGFSFLMAIALELLRRLFYLVEEVFHITGRYDGSWLQLLKELFIFNYPTLFTVGISFPIVLTYCMKSESLPWDGFSVPMLCLMFSSTYIASKFLKIEQSPVFDNIKMERICPLNIGSIMALFFYYGYLQLVLPARGENQKGLVERIRDYRDSHDLNDDLFPVKKLFILIPSSTFLPSYFEEVSFGWMEGVQTLEEQIRTRAGVIDRSYKNSVYKIEDPSRPGQPVYVVAEGASPLKTLSEAIKNSGEKKEFFEMHKKQIILSFYEQLRKILKKHRECSDLCELIYYKDTDNRGRANVNIARIILSRIQDIQQREILLQLERGEGI